MDNKFLDIIADTLTSPLERRLVALILALEDRVRRLEIMGLPRYTPPGYTPPGYTPYTDLTRITCKGNP